MSASSHQHNSGEIRISVVITTHNRSALLARALESVFAQSRAADEVIVIDDGSTDDTAEVVRRYPEVRYLWKENGGLSSARNAGVEAATCEWVAPLDDDDFYGPTMLEAIQQAFQTDPNYDVFYTATRKITLSGEEIARTHRGHRTPTDALDGMARENFVLSSAVCARRSVLMAAGNYDTQVRLAVDHDLWLRVAANGGRFRFIDEALASITKQPKAMSSSSLRLAQATLNVLELRRSLLEEGCGTRKWWKGAAHYRIGRLHWERGEYEHAKASFDAALQYDGKHLGARIYRWSLVRPDWIPLFIPLRQGKRFIFGLLQKARLLEDRWGHEATHQLRIAVVIPTYNRSSLVSRAIKSVIAQTRSASEIFVVNDGSTDDTGDVVDRYEGVRQIRKENGGLSTARNAGISAAESEWVALLDDDDWFAPQILAELEKVQLQTDADVVYSASYRVDASANVIGRNHRRHRLPSDPLRALVRENFLLCSAVLVRKQILVDAGLFDPGVRLCEDQDLWLRVASLGARFRYVNQPLAYITKSAGSMSASGVRMAEATLAVLTRRREFLKRLGGTEGSEWWLAYSHYRLGRAQWENGDPGAAVASFHEASRLDPQLHLSRVYYLALSKPALTPAFRHLRNVKRGIVSLLQRWGALEARWG